MKSDKKNNQTDDFDQKLRNFENKLNKPSEKNYAVTGDGSDNPWLFVFRAGIELVSAFIVGILIGYGLDYWLSTKPIFIIIFAVLGMVAGIFNIWHLVKPGDIRLK